MLGDELMFCVWWEIYVIKFQVTNNTTTNITYLAIRLRKLNRIYNNINIINCLASITK